ncbi:hypothetical protein GCM10023229_34240 [Flavisolibacter ginsenosidimutans]
MGLLVWFYLLLTFLIWEQLTRQIENDRSETIQAAIQHHHNLVISLEQHTIRTIRDADAVLQLVKMENSRLGRKTNLQKLFENGLIDLPSFDGLVVTDSSGNVVMAYPLQTEALRINVSGRKGFQWHKEHKDSLIISRPIQSKTIGKTVIVLSRRIDDSKGHFGGTVAIQLQPSTFMAFYNQASMNRYDLMSLISPEGITYSRRTGSVESSGEDISRSPLFDHVKKQPVGMYFAKDAIREFPTFFSYRQLKNYPIIATVGSREADVLAHFRIRRKREYIFGGIISFLLLVFLLAIYFFFLQRKKSTRILKKSETRYRSIFEGSQDGILLLKPDGSIEAMNHAACALFQLSVSENSGIYFSQLFDVVLPEIDTACLSKQLHDQGKKEFEFTCLDGSHFIGEIACSIFNDQLDQPHTIVLIRDITRRKQIEKRLEREQKRYQQSLTRQIIAAQERERATLSHELHDNVNQILTTVKLYLETALVNEAEKNNLLTKSMTHVMHCIREIRNLSHRLLPPSICAESLVESIEGLIENLSPCTTFDINFQVDNYRQPVSKELGLAVYRILQEQLNNIVKHANASVVNICLWQSEKETHLLIEDDGKGFDPGIQSKGIGLNNISSRIRAFNGKFSLNAGRGKGCRLQIRFPFSEESSEGYCEKKLMPEDKIEVSIGDLSQVSLDAKKVRL